MRLPEIKREALGEFIKECMKEGMRLHIFPHVTAKRTVGGLQHSLALAEKKRAKNRSKLESPNITIRTSQIKRCIAILEREGLYIFFLYHRKDLVTVKC